MSFVIRTKQIRPKKLNIKEVRAEIEKQMLAEGEAIVKEYEKTVATWSKKPEFEILTDISNGEVAVLVGTDSEVYKFVDEGTRPHIIRPRRARFLRFQVGYRAKTTPNVIGSKAGGKFGPVTYRKIVRHPGTDARNFTRAIARKRRKPFRDAMLKAARRGAEKANRRGQA